MFKRAEETGEVAYGVVEEIGSSEQPIRTAFGMMPKYWGNPIKEDKGEVWKKLGYIGFQAGFDYAQRAVGWSTQMGLAEPLRKAGAGALQDPMVYRWLKEGTYAERVADMVDAEGWKLRPVSESEKPVEIARAEAYQRAFNESYEDYLKKGYSENRAAKAAAADALQVG